MKKRKKLKKEKNQQRETKDRLRTREEPGYNEKTARTSQEIRFNIDAGLS